MSNTKAQRAESLKSAMEILDNNGFGLSEAWKLLAEERAELIKKPTLSEVRKDKRIESIESFTNCEGKREFHVFLNDGFVWCGYGNFVAGDAAEIAEELESVTKGVAC